MIAQQRSEKTGVFLVLGSALLWGIFPILINRGVQNIPPLTFAAFITIIGAFGALLYSTQQKTLHEVKRREAYFSLLMVTLCITLIPTILLFIGTSKTNALNTSLLQLAEIIFTLILTHFTGEKTTITKLIGALGILTGLAFILYRGAWQFNVGDMLIITSTVFYPIGNFYSKKAIGLVSPGTILVVRWTLGGVLILLLAGLIEGTSSWGAILTTYWPTLIFSGLILYALSKVLWYESFKRLDITKAVSLIMTSYFFSFIILVFLGEKISLFQIIGVCIMTVGVIFSIRRKSALYEHA